MQVNNIPIELRIKTNTYSKKKMELRRIEKSKPLIKLNIEDKIIVFWPGMSSSKGIMDCSTDLLKDVAAKG